MKQALVAAVVAAAVAAVGASASTPTASVTIRHQVKGCHTWSAGGSYASALRLSLQRGDSIVFYDHDVMPHRLVQVAGPKIAVPFAGLMNRRHLSVGFVFAKAGTYRFTTKAGEDWIANAKTVGEDNTLTLTVNVT